MPTLYDGMPLAEMPEMPEPPPAELAERPARRPDPAPRTKGGNGGNGGNGGSRGPAAQARGGGSEARPATANALASAAATPVLAPRPAQAGGGRTPAAVRATAPTAASDEPRLIRITIQTSGDKERDKRRLRRVHGLLTSYPGGDHFEFAVYDYDERSYQLRFPNDSTGFCPDLERLLHELLGPDTVEVYAL